MSQIDTENDKNPKNFQFSKISCIFCKFLTDLANWNVEKDRQGKNVLSSMLRKEINTIFQKEIVRNRDRKRQNFEKLSNSFFSTFCQNIYRLRGLQCLNA